MNRVALAVLLLALLGMASCGEDPSSVVPAQPPDAALDGVRDPAAQEPARVVPTNPSPKKPVPKTPPLPTWTKVSNEQIAEARKHGVPVAFENELGMRFVLIPAGTFLMGDPHRASLDGKRHQHEETVLQPYYMQVTEVTNTQYRRFVAGHVCAERDGYNLEGPDKPVCAVTWNEAFAFATWAGARLPSEIEWERAARGGLAGKEYPWGDEWDPNRVNHVGEDDGYEQSAPVGLFPPNRYGLYDMTGNVGEWCSDVWKPSPPRGTDLGFTVRLRGDWSEMTPEEAERSGRMEAEEAKLPHRAVRGGSWMGPNVNCASRFGLAEIRRNIATGFRLVSPLLERGIPER